MENVAVMTQIQEARRLHNLGSISDQATANGWQILLLTELRKLNHQIEQLLELYNQSLKAWREMGNKFDDFLSANATSSKATNGHLR